MAHPLGRLHTDSRSSDGHTLRTESRIARRAGPFCAEDPPEQAVTLARKMREASLRGGLPAEAARRDDLVAALRLPEAVASPRPPPAARVPSRSAFFRLAQAGFRREMVRSAGVGISDRQEANSGRSIDSKNA